MPSEGDPGSNLIPFMATSLSLPTQDALVGGKYRLREVIGSGGVGTVYRAVHLWTEREVAMKILDPSLPHFDLLRAAFLREARAAVQLDHPNVVDVLDMGEDETGTTYMVMELLDGLTLRDALVEQGQLSVADTAAVLLPVVDALEMAHARAIIHKDFKPENIILSVDAFDVMTPKLLDFGVAQILRESRPRGLTAARDVIVGTPQYMSPEQAQDQRHLIGPQTDVWGVGVVWYECLTGRCPFDGDTPLEILKAVCEAPIDFEAIPEEQVPFLRGALEREPAKRTPSLSILRAQLEESGALGPESSVKRIATSSRPPPSERPSYVRRTLQGVGPLEASVQTALETPVQTPLSTQASGPRVARVDSELLTLPGTSHRKATLGGIALAIAICVAAWWTIVGSPADTPAPAPAPVIESPRSPVGAPEPGPALEAQAKPAAPAEPAAETEAEAEDGAPAEEAAIDREEPGSSEQPPALATEPGSATQTELRSAPRTKAAPQARKPKPRTARPRSRPSPPSPDYAKPPDLVTEW